MPLTVALACAVLGVIAGALTWFRSEGISLVAGVAAFIGSTELARRMAPAYEAYWWQPLLVTASAFLIAILAEQTIRRRIERSRS